MSQSTVQQALKALRILEELPILHRLNLKNLSEPLYGSKMLSYNPTHMPCDYLCREPAFQSDCDCGTFNARYEEIKNARDNIIEAVKKYFGQEKNI